MKKIKVNLMVLIGVMVAVGTMAFHTSKVNMKLADNHWFEVNDFGQIADYIGEAPQADCNLDNITPRLCAVRLLDSQVDDPTSMNPSSLITDPKDAEQQKYGIPKP